MKILKIGGEEIPYGARKDLSLFVAKLPTDTPLHLPVRVVRGKEEGPRLFISAAIHGDELNGVEIVRQVLEEARGKLLRGTLIAVPIVNVFGFLQQSRYLPDRRDLNRCFPGSPKGSLAGRLAHLFLTEVVNQCTHGIDLHTASSERHNLPQVRGDLANKEARRCAEAFGAPAMINSKVRDGSLRGAAKKAGIPVLVYEGGESLRFNRGAIDTGVQGVMRVMSCLDMIKVSGHGLGPKSVEIIKSSWVRARRAGLVRLDVDSGDRVEAKQKIGVIGDPLGGGESILRSPHNGLVIGRANNPVANQGDALVHVGEAEA